MSKQEKVSLAQLISMVLGLAGIIGILLSAEHRMTQLETQFELVIEIQKEMKKETLPKIASDLRDLRDLYLGIKKFDSCVTEDSRKPEKHIADGTR